MTIAQMPEFVIINIVYYMKGKVNCCGHKLIQSIGVDALTNHFIPFILVKDNTSITIKQDFKFIVSQLADR